jgi:hypothetical protein
MEVCEHGMRASAQAPCHRGAARNTHTCPPLDVVRAAVLVVLLALAVQRSSWRRPSQHTAHVAATSMHVPAKTCALPAKNRDAAHPVRAIVLVLLVTQHLAALAVFDGQPHPARDALLGSCGVCVCVRACVCV